jgi:hypothetical protein
MTTLRSFESLCTQGARDAAGTVAPALHPSPASGIKPHCLSPVTGTIIGSCSYRPYQQQGVCPLLPTIGRRIPVNRGDIWPRESDLSDWLISKDGLELIADDIGLEMEDPQPERGLGDFPRDISVRTDRSRSSRPRRFSRECRPTTTIEANRDNASAFRCTRGRRRPGLLLT